LIMLIPTEKGAYFKLWKSGETVCLEASVPDLIEAVGYHLTVSNWGPVRGFHKTRSVFKRVNKKQVELTEFSQDRPIIISFLSLLGKGVLSFPEKVSVKSPAVCLFRGLRSHQTPLLKGKTSQHGYG